VTLTTLVQCHYGTKGTTGVTMSTRGHSPRGLHQMPRAHSHFISHFCYHMHSKHTKHPANLSEVFSNLQHTVAA